MLIEHKGSREPSTKKKGRSTSEGNPGARTATNKGKSRQQDKGNSQGDSNKSKKDLHGANVLMCAINSGEDVDRNGVTFFQLGTVNTPNIPEIGTSSDSNTPSTDHDKDWDHWVEQDSGDIDNSIDEINETRSIRTAPTTSNTTVVVNTPPSAVTSANRSDVMSAITCSQTSTRSEHNESGTNVTNNVIPTTTGTRPDPPGSRNTRSEGTTQFDRPPQITNTNLLLKNRSGWEAAPRRLQALDLALDADQINRLIETPSCRYPNRIKNVFAQGRGGISETWMLLDGESSMHLITNANMLTNIRTAPNGAKMNIHCNAGVAETNQIGKLPGFGTVWFCDKGIANALSLALVTDKCRVTMDSTSDNAMCVHKDNGDIRRFQRGVNDLCCCDTKLQDGALLTVATAKGKKAMCSALDC